MDPAGGASGLARKEAVVLLPSSEDDLPFDLRHIRAIHYVVTEPPWGAKLIDELVENVLSAIQNHEESIFRGNHSRTA